VEQAVVARLKEAMMEIMLFSTHVPQGGQFGAWLPLKRQANGSAAKLSVTAFRPYRIDWQKAVPIFGDIEWRERTLDQADKTEVFTSGMVDVLLGADTPCPRIRFHGEGLVGGDLRVLVQFHDIDAAA